MLQINFKDKPEYDACAGFMLFYAVSLELTRGEQQKDVEFK
jgi:hypothetical protein